jgi:hypothetical protein
VGQHDAGHFAQVLAGHGMALAGIHPEATGSREDGDGDVQRAGSSGQLLAHGAAVQAGSDVGDQQLSGGGEGGCGGHGILSLGTPSSYSRHQPRNPLPPGLSQFER